MIKLITLLRPFARYFLIGWVITIILVSSTPNIPTLKIHTGRSEIRLDYIIHFCEYAVLAFMAFLSFAGKEYKINYKKFVLITVTLIIFAVIDEYHQKLIPGRSFNVNDIVSNISGILAALLYSVVIFRKIDKNIKNPE